MTHRGKSVNNFLFSCNVLVRYGTVIVLSYVKKKNNLDQRIVRIFLKQEAKISRFKLRPTRETANKNFNRINI